MLSLTLILLHALRQRWINSELTTVLPDSYFGDARAQASFDGGGRRVGGLCYQSARTMIIDGDDLRRDAPAVVGEVERFVGLPPQPPLAAEDVTEASVRKKIAKTFPSFDERIGWSIHGVYDEEGLPGEVEERLSRFFRPHDDAFFEILGRRLAWRN